MRLTASIDVRPVGTYYGQLAAALRQDLPRTLRFEAAATVRRVMQMSRAGSVSKIKKSAAIAGMTRKEYDPKGTLRLNIGTGRRGGTLGMVWGFNANTQKAFALGVWDLKNKTYISRRPKTGRFSHVSITAQGLWRGKMDDVKQETERRLAARGIDAKSWLGIIEKLGTGQAVAPEYVRRAKPIRKAPRVVAFAGTEGANTSSPAVVIANTSGLSIATGGEKKLEAAITARRNAFRIAMGKGLFSNAAFIARNYPWASVSFG